MYINNWNRESVMKQIRLKNKGYRCNDIKTDFCKYDDGDDNHCLVGCFIPSSEYCASMESKPADDVIYDFDLEGFMPMESSQMKLLQKAHDHRGQDDYILEGVNAEEYYKNIENCLIQMELNYNV